MRVVDARIKRWISASSKLQLQTPEKRRWKSALRPQILVGFLSCVIGGRWFRSSRIEPARCIREGRDQRNSCLSLGGGLGRGESRRSNGVILARVGDVTHTQSPAGQEHVEAEICVHPLVPTPSHPHTTPPTC